jgi:AraC family transcriptional regulator, transcriptional activator of the genes for pyochelin and ferripyochelin receptors
MPEHSPPSSPSLFRKLNLRNDLIVHIAEFKPHRTMQQEFEIHDSWLRFTFYLEGDGHLERRVSSGSVVSTKARPIERCSSVSFFPEQKGTICFPAKRRQFHLTIQISPALLNTFTGGRFRRLPIDLNAISNGCATIDFFHSGPLSPVMDATIHQLLVCPYSGPLGQIYQESKAIELIAHKLAQLESSAGTSAGSSRLPLREINRVYHAKDILIRDLENPPRLFELSRKVGTTHTQLNRGFRSMFGTSVFGYLRKMRLERARHLLEKERLNVTEAAFAVGYNSLSSFSRAFSAHFGLTPASCLKRDRASA